VRRYGMRATSDAIKLTRAEANFRAMAFRIVYDHVFANVADLTARFAYAIAYSAREMNDRNLFQSWWAWTGGRSMKGLLESGHEPPAELRPFVESYLRAVGARARQTGDDVADLI
jgi:hypothetical protein